VNHSGSSRGKEREGRQLRDKIKQIQQRGEEDENFCLLILAVPKIKPNSFRDSRSRAGKKEELGDNERSTFHKAGTTQLRGMAKHVADDEKRQESAAVNFQ
jgi:hypothetical protein